ncbi:galactose mutarotase-like protein [Gonapodya prolifera JEL478]|uniref:Glucose-6-phosphate 1-epimerase n=1 Tax=Gonapodya prolifera (strain JEL478) TaxID=1344416 RepID=A0A139A9L2_GONPJ|nr:galactose mutarotase-like protein [Gonapodya prolifera JEL478]|eukprot:KXS13456.1 galactose mutarotase-like protein [Gonapodya prolifera JEL478]
MPSHVSTLPDGKTPRTVTLTRESDSVEIYVFGATVTSWKVAGQEMLFVSPKAVLDGSKAIRGGIPVVFPIFGTDPVIKLPQHGVARTSVWKFGGVTSETSSAVTGVFQLSSESIDPALAAIWPHKFKLTYSVTLGKDSLQTKLDVENVDTAEWSFEALLHNYIAVDDPSRIKIYGLKDASFFDKSHAIPPSQHDYIELNHEIDRVHTVADRSVPIVVETMRSPKGVVRVEREGRGFDSLVLWNPWATKSENIVDLGRDAWSHFICVEPGAVDKSKVTVKPRETWTAKQTIRAA